MPVQSPSYHLVVRRKGVGDTLAVSPLARDLHRHIPGVRTSVDGTAADELFRFDPRVTPRDPAAVEVVIDYKPTVDRAGGVDPDRPDFRAPPDHAARYLHAAHDAFEAATGVAVPRGAPAPELVLGPDELTPPEPAPYWVLAAGHKLDIPAKAWPFDYADAVVEATAARGWRWVQVGQVFDGRLPHRQRLAPGAKNLLGKTSLRQLVRLVAHAEGVLALCSLPMLVAAATGTPCVAVGGGREDPWLHAGSGVTYLHTVGRLACCADRGCRAWAALPGRRQEEFGRGWRLCADPVDTPAGFGVGRCMTLLTPEVVVGALAAAKRGDRRRHNNLPPGVSGGGGPSGSRLSLPVTY